ncbi:hypothetical protein [Hoeflea sp.]|uniref:hypothetical protein n=1 Tax=Hoeflea sp. TaxID=1940281 RepID=UPI003BB1F5AA
MPRPAIFEPVDLFRWRDARDIEDQRRELARRIEKLKPNSWRRIELQAQLARLTVQALELETTN